MTGGMKYQQAKKVKRKGVSNRPTDDGSDLTDLAQDAGAPMDGADKHMAQMFLDGNEEALIILSDLLGILTLAVRFG